MTDVFKASSASTSVSYTVTTSDASPPPYYFRAFATATNATGTSSIATSSIILSSLPAPTGGSVSISTNTGTYAVGSVITYSTSGWSNSPTSYSLRLYNGTNPVLTSDPLRASTSSSSGTYTITSSDVPNYFKAYATATNSGGTSSEVGSSQVGPATSGGGGGGSAPALISLTGNNSLALGGTFSWSFSNSPTAYSLLVQGPTGTVYTTSNAYTYTGTTFRPAYDGTGGTNGTGWQGSGNYTIYISARNASGSSSVSSQTTAMS
jgi:hypothetical protein